MLCSNCLPWSQCIPLSLRFIFPPLVATSLIFGTLICDIPSKLIGNSFNFSDKYLPKIVSTYIFHTVITALNLKLYVMYQYQ